VIGLAFQVGGCGWFWCSDLVTNGHSNQRYAIAHAIERPPPETTDYFEHRVVDLTDNLGLLKPPEGAFWRLVEKASRSEPSSCSGFISAVIPI
jgi:hypothetical protein